MAHMARRPLKHAKKTRMAISFLRLKSHLSKITKKMLMILCTWGTRLGGIRGDAAALRESGDTTRVRKKKNDFWAVPTGCHDFLG